MNISELETWLTEEGDRIVRLATTNGYTALTSDQQLTYQVWLFDTEQRNGGVSQYFCNRGIEQWGELQQVAMPSSPAFASFAALVNQVICNTTDAYKTILTSPTDLDAAYITRRAQIFEDIRNRLK